MLIRHNLYLSSMQLGLLLRVDMCYIEIGGHLYLSGMRLGLDLRINTKMTCA